MDVAVDNGGYVTPALVAPHGVPAVELRKMVSRGTLHAAARGVYRIPSLPYDPLDEFILARLWAAGRGVISHDSALSVHELCDINPTKVHLTIPSSYRISRSGGERYALHRADLEPEQITRIDALTLTTIRRTLTDSVGPVPAYRMRAATTTARERRSGGGGRPRGAGPAGWLTAAHERPSTGSGLVSSSLWKQPWTTSAGSSCRRPCATA
ncbi:MAG: hypothetical protein AB1673_14775 [Actinomycetota bacterium]